jgi:hypothetical protein
VNPERWRHIERHLVDRFGELLPDTGHALDLRLASELAFRTDFTGDTRDFRREDGELIDHLVDQLRRAQKLLV